MPRDPLPPAAIRIPSGSLQGAPRLAAVLVLSLAVPLLPAADSAPPRPTATPPAGRTRLSSDGPGARAPAHSAGVTCVAWSPDGKVLLTAGGDGLVRLWDAATAEPLRRLDAHGWVCQAAFSPDGRRLACGGYGSDMKSGAIDLWDTATGERLTPLYGHNDGTRALAFAPDGKRLASGGFDDAVRVWDLDSGRAVLALPAHKGGVSSVAWSPDGRLLASCGYDGAARLWDAATGKLLRVLTAGEQKTLYHVAFSPDGRLVACAGDDMTVRVLETASGKEARRLTGHTALVHNVAFSRDGRTLSTGGYDNTARLWELAGGRQILLLDAHAEWVWSTAPAPDGRRLATAGKDGQAYLWDIAAALGVTEAAGSSPRLAPEAAERLWHDLADADAGRAHAALWRLALAPDVALPTLAARVVPAASLAGQDRRRLDQLLRDLDDDSYAVREEASRHLERAAAVLQPELQRALDDGPSPEVRRRLEWLLDGIRRPVPQGDALRLLRVVQLLEIIGTPPARDLLRRLAGGDPDAPLTHDARASLARLGTPPPAAPPSRP